MAKKLLVILSIVLWFGTAFSGTTPNVEYSADSVMETADGVMKGRVYVAPGKERREYDQDGEPMVMIVRNDKKVTWMLMPGNLYMENKFPKEGRKDDMSSYKIETTTIGPETVNGINTTKSKVIMTGPNNSKLGGFSWVSKEGITVKLDAISVEGGTKERFKTELNNLQIGPQDKALFEIPKGYKKMNIGGMGQMMFRDDEGDDDGEGTHEPPQPRGGKKGFSWKDAVDMMK